MISRWAELSRDTAEAVVKLRGPEERAPASQALAPQGGTGFKIPVFRDAQQVENGGSDIDMRSHPWHIRGSLDDTRSIQKEGNMERQIVDAACPEGGV